MLPGFAGLGDEMENYNKLMNDFKDQCARGGIQRAYQYIFALFADVGHEIVRNRNKMISVNSLYHGYLDMTYLPVTTDILKENGLKIAVVFNYSLFRFELWLSAINRKKRTEVLAIMSQSKWKKYKTVENDGNTDALIERAIKGIDDFNDRSGIASLITKESITFINDIESFIRDYGTGRR